jgi:cytochrome c-type biogenesis protein CcmH/NrfG
MKKHYLLAGIVIAAIVAVVVVVVGTASGPDSSSETPTATQSLPAGHPSVGSSQQPSSSDQYGKMVAGLKKKYDSDPTDITNAIALGDAYLMSEQGDKAIPVYLAVLKLDPKNETATAQLGLAYHGQKDDAKSIAMLESALATNPDSQIAHYNLAIIYFSQQKSADAKGEWAKAAAIDPSTRLGKSAQNFVDLMEGRTPAPSGTNAH